MDVGESQTAAGGKLTDIIAALQRNYSNLAARIREAKHSVTCQSAGVTLHLHFPTIVQGKATMYDLVEAIYHYLPWFALPRNKIEDINKLYGKIPSDEYTIKISQLYQSAEKLFKKVQKATNRNGEAGELLLFILTEWILAAPQLLAKMSLKTSANMAVNGTDGIHIHYSSSNGHLTFYWGEAKLYQNVDQAISKAIESIKEANEPDKLEYELELVSKYLDLSGITGDAKDELLRYLDPFDESYNTRLNVTTCLIGYDCSLFSKVETSGSGAEEAFRKIVEPELQALSDHLAQKLVDSGLGQLTVELFFFPVPSVQTLRDLFQEKIGWAA